MAMNKQCSNYLPVWLEYPALAEDENIWEAARLLQLPELGERVRRHFIINTRILFHSAGILEQTMGARDQVGIILSYRHARARILKKSIRARNRVGIGLSYWPARPQSTKAGEIGPWKWFLGFLKVQKYRLWSVRKNFCENERFLSYEVWITE